MILYTGKDAIRRVKTLGTHVIKELLSVVDNPSRHTITFDNFFTSYELLEDLRNESMAATGTVRENRLRSAPLPEPSEAIKQP